MRRAKMPKAKRPKTQPSHTFTVNGGEYTAVPFSFTGSNKHDAAILQWFNHCNHRVAVEEVKPKELDVSWRACLAEQFPVLT